jgi:hypothetical protein
MGIDDSASLGCGKGETINGYIVRQSESSINTFF